MDLYKVNTLSNNNHPSMNKKKITAIFMSVVS